MNLRTVRLPALLLASAWPTLAAAQVGGASPAALSADPELVHIRFGHNAIPGVVVPDHDVARTVHWGVFFQYELNPVVGYRLDEWAGNIVVNRIQAHFGAAVDVTKFMQVRLSVPWAVTSGSMISELAPNDGNPFVAFGDVYAGLTITPLRTRFFNLGVHGDVWLPTGTKAAYSGEASARGAGGIAAMVKLFEYFDAVADVSVLGRKYTDTRQDFELGSELYIREGARLKLPWLPVHITQALVTRGGFENFFAGGAENGVEIYGGLQIPIEHIGYNTGMNIDVMAGRGTNQGFGTTDLRVVAGLSFFRNPGRKPRVEPPVVYEPPPPIPPTIEEEIIDIPPPEPPPPEVRVYQTEEEIVIRDPIEFFVDTANIKPESLPILDQVATIMNGDYRIKHVVIEGHASEEGEFGYNYELSTRRAESIFKQLILNGVSPDRMSYKGYGEVKPKVEGSTEEAWAVNRRVEFKIVAQYPTNAQNVPDYGTTTKLPWSGEVSPIKSPPRPPSEEELRKKAEEEARKAAEEVERQRREEVKKDRFEDDNNDIQFDDKDAQRQRPERKQDDLGDERFDTDDDDAPAKKPAPAEPAPAE
ncbi:MAG TPA: OmpA family protein, partial [Myxococcota bacterium]|nr:OmpA family protein [Myxococcota bacterium]